MAHRFLRKNQISEPLSFHMITISMAPEVSFTHKKSMNSGAREPEFEFVCAIWKDLNLSLNLSLFWLPRL